MPTADAGSRVEWNLHTGLTAAEKHAVTEVMEMPGFYRSLELRAGDVAPVLAAAARDAASWAG